MRVDIASLGAHIDQEVKLHGWIANKRTGKGLVFLELRDGSGFCQCVIDESAVDAEQFDSAKRAGLGSSIKLAGKAVADERQIGGVELQVSNMEIIQNVEDYPISKKAHGVDFLLEHRHLWLRSKRQWAIMRIRSRTKYAIHTFFQERNFTQADSPIFTGNACEGTTTLFSTDFYGEEAYLSQSGQLYAEASAMALGKVYTFGPTFRAEKSKTRRHLSEFWMIEPEMPFYDLDMNMELIEEFLKYIVTDIYTTHRFELEILERDLSLFENINKPFPKITYDDAVKILKGEKEIDGQNALDVLKADLETVRTAIEEKQADITERETAIAAGGMKKGAINFNRNKIDVLKNEVKELEEQQRNIPQWLESAKNFTHGEDLGGSDETVITRLFTTPIMVYKWPKDIKAFYMKRDEGDDNYVKGVDVLAPNGFGEIVGGAEREDSLELLEQRIKEHDLPMEDFSWYRDLRKYGSVPHAGFGLGFERMVMWLTNAQHIRETIPFPRYYGRLNP
ncbi:asparagine--tRNA ligase [Chitinophagales bacterium]|nr:asparagine--tRNA ligase [Chitinophagales bacterium]